MNSTQIQNTLEEAQKKIERRIDDWLCEKFSDISRDVRGALTPNDMMSLESEFSSTYRGAVFGAFKDALWEECLEIVRDFSPKDDEWTDEIHELHTRWANDFVEKVSGSIDIFYPYKKFADLIRSSTRTKRQRQKTSFRSVNEPFIPSDEQ